MAKVISIGKQSFSALREQDYFFVDKTNLIKEWWEKGMTLPDRSSPTFWQDVEYEYVGMFLFE